MASNIQVRLVNVEFLRPGPPQNQLLSPLTQYLAVCGDAGAGVMTVPYEHATFERKLKELRYETGDPGDRLAMLHDVGVDMGRILGSVPGLPGSLTTDPNQEGLLVHLRLTLSASELALLPFEFAKVPVGPNSTTESWLAIQTRPPVAVTRHIRTVSAGRRRLAASAAHPVRGRRSRHHPLPGASRRIGRGDPAVHVSRTRRSGEVRRWRSRAIRRVADDSRQSDARPTSSGSVAKRGTRMFTC